MQTATNADSLSLTTRGVLDDLVSERGLVEWTIDCAGPRDVVFGSAILDRLQDNRLQRKRQPRGESASAGDEQRALCGFVILATAQDPSVSVDSLLSLYEAAMEASAVPPERVYLCLTDAGSISYYRLGDPFASLSA